MKTINLLPKNRQNELYFDSVLGSLWIIVILSCLSFALVFLAQFGTKFYLQLEANTIKAEIRDLKVQVGKQQNTDVKAKVQAANNLIKDYKNLLDSSAKWSKLIIAFAPLPPAGIKVNNFSVDPLTKAVNINGFSTSRELVIQLYNNILQDDKEFYGINYPLENIASAKDINYHFTFYYKPELIQ